MHSDQFTWSAISLSLMLVGGLGILFATFARFNQAEELYQELSNAEQRLDLLGILRHLQNAQLKAQKCVLKNEEAVTKAIEVLITQVSNLIADGQIPAVQYIPVIRDIHALIAKIRITYKVIPWLYWPSYFLVGIGAVGCVVFILWFVAYMLKIAY